MALKNLNAALACLLLSLCLGWNAHASELNESTSQKYSEKTTLAQWKSRLFARTAEDTLSSSKIIGLIGIFDLNHKLSDSLFTELRIGAVFEAGSSSSLFTDEFRPESVLFLDEASVSWQACSVAAFRFGALDQTHLESSLLIDSRHNTFPAALEILEKSFANFTAHLDAQQAIPTSERLTSKNTGKENTPSLLTETASLEYEDKGAYRLKARATAFSFHSLTHGMAQDSRFYGNTVTGIAAGSTYFYDYKGLEAGGQAEINITKKITLHLDGSLLHNNEVPESQSNGQYFLAKLELEQERFRISPRYEFYRNEANSAPAFYTNREFGHNNRKGNGLAVRISLRKEKVDFEARWMQSHLIEQNTFQRDKFQYIQLFMEIPYASI